MGLRVSRVSVWPLGGNHVVRSHENENQGERGVPCSTAEKVAPRRASHRHPDPRAAEECWREEGGAELKPTAGAHPRPRSRASKKRTAEQLEGAEGSGS